MNRRVGAAAALSETGRRDLAVQALARSATISDLAVQHDASRKFVYQQMRKAGAALDDAFLSAAPDQEVLFTLMVTKTWLRQVIVGLALICHSSYRGIVEFLRDLLGISISVGSVHQVLQFVTQNAGVLNRDQDLSGIGVGLHDEIFHDGKPVLPSFVRCSLFGGQRYLVEQQGKRLASSLLLVKQPVREIWPRFSEFRC